MKVYNLIICVQETLFVGIVTYKSLDKAREQYDNLRANHKARYDLKEENLGVGWNQCVFIDPKDGCEFILQLSESTITE